MYKDFVNSQDIEVIRLDAEFYDPEYVTVIKKIKKNPYSCDYLKNLASGIKDGPGGWAVSTDDYTETGIPVIRTVNILAGFVNLDECVFISDRKHEELIKHKVTRGDVVLSVRGTIGNAAIFNNYKYKEASINAAVVKMHTNSNIDPYYLISFFSCYYGKKQTERISNGAVQNNMNLTEVGSNLIPYPPTEIQISIGNKIRKSERLRELANSCSQNIYKAINDMYIELPNERSGEASWVRTHALDARRIDAWFHKPYYIEMARQLGTHPSLIKVKQLSKIVKERVDLALWPANMFDYYEISGIDSNNGDAIPEPTLISEAPSRATTLVREGDLLISTVRPNLKAIGQISPRKTTRGVASSGFCVLRAESAEIAAYIRACLIQDAGTQQLMRWNTGGSYPAIEQSVPGEALIPYPGANEVCSFGNSLLRTSEQLEESNMLFESAKNDVVCMIEGNLNSEVLLSENDFVEKWLKTNPSPYTSRGDS